MGRARLTGAPRTWVLDGHEWPGGELAEDTPTTVRYAQHISLALAEALEAKGLKISTTAREMGIARQTLHDVLSGRSVIDLHTLIKLEDFLNTPLYPQRRKVSARAKAAVGS